jgi:hypothetical protein
MKSICLALVMSVVLLGPLDACDLGSHDYVRTQEFSGVLLKGGVPMAGAAVLVSHSRGDDGNYCANPEVITATSESGTFRVPARTQARDFGSRLNPPGTVLQMTAICFRALGQQKLGALVIAPTDHEVKYSAICDWDSPSVEFTQKVQMNPNQWGICKRANGTTLG